MICTTCPRACDIPLGGTGFCRARINVDGEIVAGNYGRLTALALDPIEKKPLRRFQPGSKILSVGSYGCNLTCSFCQNYRISMAGAEEVATTYLSPEELAEQALSTVPEGNIGVAFTYNEPMVGWEYVRDTGRLLHQAGLKNVLVTNGYVSAKVREEVYPLMDAINIDLKAFTESFYQKVGAHLETVKDSIELAAASTHLEVTTLIIPGENDSDEEMRELSRWLSAVNPEIPLHISRFFPTYKMTEKNPTPSDRIIRLTEIARQHLTYVYAGNL